MSNDDASGVRSPSYPVMPLSDAVAGVRKIEAQYRSAKVDRVAAAKIIGYSGLSGPANKALAALAQYGLVERAGKGEMRVTARARAILHPDSAEEKRRELRAAAFEPRLFQELQDRYGNLHPPEDGVVIFLNRKGFNQTAIRPAAKAYLQTLLYLEEEGVTESHGVPPGEGPDPLQSEQSLEPPVNMEPKILGPAPLQPAQIEAIAEAVVGAPLNKINMNIQADVVHLNATLDYRGLVMLEKKIASLKALMAPDCGEVENDRQG